MSRPHIKSIQIYKRTRVSNEIDLQKLHAVSTVWDIGGTRSLEFLIPSFLPMPAAVDADPSSSADDATNIQQPQATTGTASSPPTHGWSPEPDWSRHPYNRAISPAWGITSKDPGDGGAHPDWRLDYARQSHSHGWPSASRIQDALTERCSFLQVYTAARRQAPEWGAQPPAPATHGSGWDTTPPDVTYWERKEVGFPFDEHLKPVPSLAHLPPIVYEGPGRDFLNYVRATEGCPLAQPQPHPDDPRVCHYATPCRRCRILCGSDRVRGWLEVLFPA